MLKLDMILLLYFDTKFQFQDEHKSGYERWASTFKQIHDYRNGIELADVIIIGEVYFLKFFRLELCYLYADAACLFIFWNSWGRKSFEAGT